MDPLKTTIMGFVSNDGLFSVQEQRQLIFYEGLNPQQCCVDGDSRLGWRSKWRATV
jgi:hypothetical protein